MGTQNPHHVVPRFLETSNVLAAAAGDCRLLPIPLTRALALSTHRRMLFFSWVQEGVGSVGKWMAPPTTLGQEVRVKKVKKYRPPKPPHINHYISPYTEALYRCELGCSHHHDEGFTSSCMDSIATPWLKKKACLSWWVLPLAVPTFEWLSAVSRLVLLTVIRFPSHGRRGC